jgi:leucyl-tRNA synthetase
VNGKVRSKLTLPVGTSGKDIEAAALADAKVREFMNGKPPKKVIVVQGKLVNVVV